MKDETKEGGRRRTENCNGAL